jgi:hypothetical protein
MNYKGKLYGRIGNNTYFDTAYTTDDWDAMEAKIKEIEKVKRKPLSDGTLELTESELEEFDKLFYHNTKCLKISASGVFILSNAEKNIINNYKAILWLAERFDLTSNN